MPAETDRKALATGRLLLADAIEDAFGSPHKRQASALIGSLVYGNLPVVLAALRSEAGAEMRERPGTGQQAVAAMREKCAAWHEDRAAQHDASAQTEDGLEAVRHHSRECRRHLEYAAELRSLPLQPEGGETP